ncbi:MAG: hypothetical protein ACYTEM_05980, partial [Planctomycetota bacterium]
STEFFFPFPDYKIPDAVFSQQLLDTTNISGLLGKFESRDYSRPHKPLFSEKQAWKSISENNLVPIFSNSFLIVANKGDNHRMVLDGLGVVTNTDRVPSFRTRSKIYCDESSNELKVSKKAIHPNHYNDLLKLSEYDELWREGRTLQSIILERACSGRHDIEFIFEPAKEWYAFILDLADRDGNSRGSKDAQDLSSYYDAIWQNTIIEEGNISLIDQEWTILSEIKPKHILIRSVYTFLAAIRENSNVSSCLRYRTGATIIKDIGTYFGESISRYDIQWLIDTESSVYASVTGKKPSYHEAVIRLTLYLNLTIMRYISKIGSKVEYLIFLRQLVPRMLSRLLLMLKKSVTKT